jgi:hypothetical protein
MPRIFSIDRRCHGSGLVFRTSDHGLKPDFYEDLPSSVGEKLSTTISIS